MFNHTEETEISGIVFNIEKYHIHDGTGIRTNVFLKGCNLRCNWCSNPESQLFEPQIGIHRNLCIGCGRCIRACSFHAISMNESEKAVVNRAICTACGGCIVKCLQSAIELYGELMSVRQVIDQVEKDRLFYNQSGGGMTIGGGEPCMQPVFAKELAKAAKRRYMNVALETAGAVPWKALWSVAEEVDEILFDVKTTDEKSFKQVSTVSLSAVKGNLKGLVEKGKNITMRCPIIPGYNHHFDHIDNLRLWAEELGIKRIDLLPFHQYGKHKYESLGYPYPMKNSPVIEQSELRAYQERLEKQGLNVCIGG